jgi:predicted deacylase
MAALREFLASLDEGELRGELRVVPMANIASFWQRTPFVVPHDQKNLNRLFPGSPGGTFSERLAFTLFENLIRPCDYFIDMHSGDLVEDLEPFVLVDDSAVGEQSMMLARAYGLDHIIRAEESASPIGGTASSAAAQHGIAAITAEVGRCGLTEPDAVERHLLGLRRALSFSGLLPATDLDSNQAGNGHEHTSWTWIRTPQEGWWTPRVAVGNFVGQGDVIGRVVSLDGHYWHDVRAPRSGYILFMTSSPAVMVDGLLLGLAS